MTPPETYDAARHLVAEQRFQEAMDLMEGFTEKLARELPVERKGQPIADARASVIITSYRDESGIEPALAELSRQVTGQPIEVILLSTGNPEFLRLGRELLDSVILIDLKHNYGPSVARNLGIHYATADILIFLDDDGCIGPGTLQTMLISMETTKALGIRGRVIASSPDLGARHYDLGDNRLRSIPNCEGISAWQKTALMAVEGFNPLLFGHEGIELCARVIAKTSSLEFFYEPKAVLFHDYCDDPAGREVKEQRYRKNLEFMQFLGGETAEQIGRRMRAHDRRWYHSAQKSLKKLLGLR